MIERYSHEKHFEMLVRWLAARTEAAPDPECFSKIGFCVDNNAIGFLVQTDSRQCYMHHVAGNPDISPEDRGNSLDVLFRVIEQEGKKLGFKTILAFSDLPSMKLRLMEHKYFAAREFTLFFKNLGG